MSAPTTVQAGNIRPASSAPLGGESARDWVQRLVPAPTRRRRLIMAVALVTMVIDTIYMAGGSLGFWIGGLLVSAAVVPGLLLVGLCGTRLLGRSTERRTAIVYWLVAAAVIAILAVVYLTQGDLALWFALVVASTGEELVYRLAIPMVLGGVLRVVGMRDNWARPMGFAFASIWFVLLPGHIAQMDGLVGPVPFVAYATLAAIIAFRSGSVLALAAAHSVSNLLTFLLWSNHAQAQQRSLVLMVLLGLLYLAYGQRRRLTVGDHGELLDIQTGLQVAEIDLRDGQPATVTLTDGTSMVIERQGVVAERASIRHASFASEPSPVG